MSKILALCLLCLISFGVVACGGGGGTPAPTPTPTPTPTPGLTVSPSTANVALGGSQVFTASTTGVTWSITGPGSIGTNGAYVAPASFVTAGPATVTVTATSGTLTAHATATVIYPNDNSGNQSVPVHLGTSGGNVLDNNTGNTQCCIGTLGSLIVRGANTYILSNNHVLARSSQAAAGEAIDQPGQLRCPAGSQGLNVADLSEQAALKPAGGVALGNAPSNVDAAIAQVVTGTVDPTGAILDLGAAGANGIAAAPPLNVPSDARLVMQANRGVAKSGRTTGLTCSTIQAVLVDNVQVAYDSSCAGPTAFTAVFNGQVAINGGTFSAGGDSGSLIVTQDTASPVALLYGGNTTSTVGNPILDPTDANNTVVAKGVLTAFNNGTAPSIVGTATPHTVSCAPTSQAQSTAVSAQSTPVSVQKQQMASAVRTRRMADIMSLDSAVRSVNVGSSLDAPGEPVLEVGVAFTPKSRIPATIDGVRTRVVYADTAAIPEFTDAEFSRGLSAKNVHRAEYLTQGFQGIGIGRSDDAPGESTIVIFTIQGMPHAAIPAVIDGVRTKVIEGEAFRSTGWNSRLEPKGACGKATPQATIKPKLK